MELKIYYENFGTGTADNCIVADDENYYMIAYDEAEDKIKHFRVDKMKNNV